MTSSSLAVDGRAMHCKIQDRCPTEKVRQESGAPPKTGRTREPRLSKRWASCQSQSRTKNVVSCRGLGQRSITSLPIFEDMSVFPSAETIRPIQVNLFNLLLS